MRVDDHVLKNFKNRLCTFCQIFTKLYDIDGHFNLNLKYGILMLINNSSIVFDLLVFLHFTTYATGPPY